MPTVQIGYERCYWDKKKQEYGTEFVNKPVLVWTKEELFALKEAHDNVLNKQDITPGT